MAYKAKLLHFKNKQSYNAERNKTEEGSDERKVFDAYLSFIDEGPTICTWGKEYKCELSLSEVEELITSKNFAEVNDIPQASSSLPLISGDASAGISSKYSREDHVHPVQTQISGNAGTATKLLNPVKINLAGDISGSSSFDGSSNITITASVEDNSHMHDNSTISNLDAAKITSGTISIDRLPKGALERLIIVANQSQRFALTEADVQEGDTVKQQDTGLMYYVYDINNLNNESGYEIYTAGSATSVPWSGVTNRPTKLSEFTNDSGFITNSSLTNYATQEWVLQQLANYVSKTGDSTISGTLTAAAFKES